MACRPWIGWVVPAAGRQTRQASAPAQRVHDLDNVAFSQDMLAMAAAADDLAVDLLPPLQQLLGLEQVVKVAEAGRVRGSPLSWMFIPALSLIALRDRNVCNLIGAPAPAPGFGVLRRQSMRRRSVGKRRPVKPLTPAYVCRIPTYFGVPRCSSANTRSAP